MIKYEDFKKKKQFALTQVIPALQNVKLFDKAKKILSCGEYLKLAVCEKCNTTHFNGANSCKDKFCPVCQKKRSLLWLTKLIPICNDLIDRGYHLNMLTYTIRVTDGMNLEKSLSILQNSFRYMTHDQKVFAKNYNELILGGVRSLEVKIGADKITGELSGKWHPHYHILVCTRGKVCYKELHSKLLDMWNRSIKVISDSKDDYCGSVNISSIKTKSNDNLVKALLEVVKYMTKFDWQGENVYELVTTLHKIRMQNTFGNFKYLLSDKQIEFEMEKSITEVEKAFCAVCGSSDFVELDYYGSDRLILYDLEHKHSSYLYVDEENEMLEEKC